MDRIFYAAIDSGIDACVQSLVPSARISFQEVISKDDVLSVARLLADLLEGALKPQVTAREFKVLRRMACGASKKEITNGGLLTKDNCAIAFIDHQPQMTFGIATIDRVLLLNNVVMLARRKDLRSHPGPRRHCDALG
jgi:hypothetical protein